MTEPEPDDREFLDAAGIDPDSLGDAVDRDPLASIAQRAFARAIDLLTVAIISLAFTVPLVERNGDDFSIPRSAQLLSLIGWLVYEAGTTAWLGQTMGKLAMHIRVVEVRRGTKPGLARSVVRAAIVPGLAAVIGLFAVLAYPTAVGDPRTRRGLLDRLSGTAVVAG